MSEEKIREDDEVSGQVDPGPEGESAPEVDSGPKDQDNKEVYFAPQIPAGSFERLQAIEEEIADLDAKHDDAEIDDKEYRALVRKLDREAGEINGAISYARNRMEDDQRAAERRFWLDENNRPWAENKGLFEALSAAVKQLRGDSSAMARGQDWILQEAKRQTSESFSKALGIAAPKTDSKSKEPANRKEKDDPVPNSLRDFPGGKGGASDEFSVVSKMDTPNQLNAMRDWSREKIQAWMDRHI